MQRNNNVEDPFAITKNQKPPSLCIYYCLQAAKTAEFFGKYAEAVQRLEGPKLAEANLESLRGLARSSRGAVGVLRGDPPPKPQIVAPLYGATILTDRPALTWPEVKADAYLVQLFSGAEGKDQRLLWKDTVKETRLTYPEKQKPLEFGKLYRWRVTPLKGEDASADPIVESKFLVLTKSEIALLSNLKPLLASKSAPFGLHGHRRCSRYGGPHCSSQQGP